LPAGAATGYVARHGTNGTKRRATKSMSSNGQNATTAIDLGNAASIEWNLSEAALYEHAIANGEARLTVGGALAATTGEHTGRSPKDKFIVRDATTEDTIWWDGNGAMEPAAFDRLLADMQAHAGGRRLYAQDLYAGADPDTQISVRLYCELAWHNLFIRNLLIRPDRADLAAFSPGLTIIDLPSFRADPARHGCRTETVIACDFSRGLVLIGGSGYAGEMKKSVFTVLNYLLPERRIMPMHCSANADAEGDVAIFFGLSGTGKTTLSTDPSRPLIGDDEHGWGENGIFNFEGGCYAKTINLSQEAEPAIYATTQRFGSVLENVVLDAATGEPDFDDASLTENGRCAYPIHFIDNASLTGRAGQPRNIVMLTCDAFGVLPPIAKLTPAQAIVHFLSGYTAKVAGTERGLTGSQATFSTCFGAPFIPRPSKVYGELLRELIERHDVNCWLVNTGWTGGEYGKGSRMPIAATRALLTAALDGSLLAAEFRTDPWFSLAVPVSVPGVDAALLDPRGTWADPAAYDAQAEHLVTMFTDNFTQYTDGLDPAICAAAPALQSAAPAT
jgi:phosphoenolpyruvate carboxykinase (ATP)